MTRSAPDRTPRHVLVVGAGIIGAACAAALTEAGLDVTVLERAERPATGASGRSVAGVRVQFTEEVNVRLSWTSIQTYAAFAERYGVDSGYRPGGYLFLVPDREWAGHLEGVAVQRRVGAPVEVLDPYAAQDRVPFVVDGVAGTTFGPADGVVDPVAVTAVYLDRARALGATVRLGTRLLGAWPKGAGWRAAYAGGELVADVIVNAAGPWAGEIASLAGLDVPVAPVSRSVFVTAPIEGPHDFPLTVDLATGFFLRGHGDRLLYGCSRPDQVPGFVEGLDWEWHRRIRECGAARFPWFAEHPVDPAASWYGHYETTPDHNPVLGRHPDAPAWVDACGFSGHGVQQAPAVAQVVAEEILAGRSTTIDVDELRIDRFRRTPEHAERHII